MGETTPASLSSTAAEIAQNAGELLRSGIPGVFGITAKSSETDVATTLDVDLEQFIVDEIRRRFPDDGILGEESGTVNGSSGRRWIIDPLDGTSNFVRGLRPSAISIAVEAGDELCAGVVYDPFAGELFAASVGNGATVNGEAVRRDDTVPLQRAFVGISGSNRTGVRERRAELLRRFALSADSARDIGSTALHLAYVACNRFDAHIGLDVKIWDAAAGLVIAREAGCRIEGLDTPEFTPDGFVVCSPSLMTPLREVISG